jgi:hypothetical protein
MAIFAALSQAHQLPFSSSSSSSSYFPFTNALSNPANSPPPQRLKIFKK